MKKVAPVAIVGAYQTKHMSANPDETLEEMIFHSVRSLLEGCGATIEDVDSIVSAGSDQIDGRAIPMMLTSGSVGAEMKDLLVLSGAGENALRLAYYRILSGVFETSLVVNWGKPSEIPQLPKVENLPSDPFYERDFGVNQVIAAALQAGAYVDKHEPSPESAARVVQKNRKNALNNPCAHLQKEVTIKEVLESKLVSWPIRELEWPPQSDGVCALLLASERKARSFGNGHAWIEGLGSSVDTYWMGDRDLTELTSVALAAERAYKMAGIRDPRNEVDVAEVQDLSAYHELMAYEALGFCDKGEGASLIEKGVTTMSGKLPVNPSGGMLSSNPATASQLVRVAEAALQVMGKAGQRQVERAKIALAQTSGGYAAQDASVFILGQGE